MIAAAPSVTRPRRPRGAAPNRVRTTHYSISSRFVAGEDLHCARCGYGIVARVRLPERCPMCGECDWHGPRSRHSDP